MFPYKTKSQRHILGTQNIARHVPFGHTELNEWQNKWFMIKEDVLKLMK